ncbi:hypothetical protein Zmor_014575 [Zophobas morio]|uniref:HTH CENPB-type domain-containing protein n=1 Tax=Zophobas morio TaxID=2755281 RepID=A0AA38IHU2_9CUCU|nr:hypothetical protein Zmor_014575 [Zophobas morio]
MKVPWNQQNLEMVVEAYRSGGVGLNEYPRRFAVLKATLKAHLNNENKVANDIKKVMVRSTTFIKNQEEELAIYLLQFKQNLYGLTIADVMKFAFEWADKNKVPYCFNHKKMAGKKWFYGFMKRNPKLSLRRPE